MMQGLGSAVRYKAYKKRPLRSTRLTFGSDFSIGVQLFATIKVPTAVLHEPLLHLQSQVLHIWLCISIFRCPNICI